jgi:hypothetical protein
VQPGSRQLQEQTTVAQKTVSKANGKARGLTKSTKKAAAVRREKPGSGKSRGTSKVASAGDELVTIDRRRGDRRQDGTEPTSNAPAAPKLERREKVNRRRQIDPTTCERDYTEQEVEFMNALDDYKRKSGRMFPTCSEVLEVIRSLGYVKLSPAESIDRADVGASAISAKPMPGDWLPQAHDSHTLQGTTPGQEPHLGS